MSTIVTPETDNNIKVHIPSTSTTNENILQLSKQDSERLACLSKSRHLNFADTLSYMLTISYVREFNDQ